MIVNVDTYWIYVTSGFESNHCELSSMGLGRLSILRQCIPPPHASVIARAMSLVSLVVIVQGEVEEALKVAQEALEIQRTCLPEIHLDIAYCMNLIGKIYYTQEKYTKALHSHEESLSIERKLLPENHGTIATSLSRIGDVHLKQGNLMDAVKLHKE